MDAAGRKRLLRSWALSQRAAIPDAERARASTAAAGHLAEQGVTRPEASVAAYCPVRAEADPSGLFDRARLAFPRVTDVGLELRWSSPEALVRQPPFGIPEPLADAPLVDPAELDLVIVPGLVFDREGSRIGYGKGYYDRLLAVVRARSNARCVGFGFEAQVIDQLPDEPFDERLDGLVTEAGLRWFSVERPVGRG